MGSSTKISSNTSLLFTTVHTRRGHFYYEGRSVGERPGVSCDATCGGGGEEEKRALGWGEPGFRASGKGKWCPRKRPGGGIRGHRWAYSDTRSGRGDDKGEEEREGRAHHDTDSVLRYATMPRDCYAIWFGKGWVILGTLPPSLPSSPSCRSLSIFTF